MVYITNKTEHGPCLYDAWVWPEKQNAFPVTAREDQGKALLADNVVAKGVIHDAVHY